MSAASRSADDRAVVTGIGVVTGVGCAVGALLGALKEGRTGIRRLEGERYDGLRVPLGAPADGFDPDAVLPASEARWIDDFALFGMAAADAALDDAGLVVAEAVDPARVAVVLSSGAGGLGLFERQVVARHERGNAAVSPYLMPGMLPNMATARIAMRHGIRGPSSTIATACSASAHAVAEALRLIRYGEADVVVCGGADSPLHPTASAAFGNARALSRRVDDPAAACRPFDTGRDGFVLGEGAGALVIERRSVADARGAAAYADLTGFGTTTDAHHPTMPHPEGEGAAACMRLALADAALSPGDVAYLNAHGTATKLGDIAETKALRAVFGDDGPAVSSTKPLTGHMLGAAGAVEAAVAVLAIAGGFMPHTVNLDDPDADCDLDHVRHAPRVQPVPAAMSNSFAFGGHNVTLVFEGPSTRTTRQPE